VEGRTEASSLLTEGIEFDFECLLSFLSLSVPLLIGVTVVLFSLLLLVSLGGLSVFWLSVFWLSVLFSMLLL